MTKEVGTLAELNVKPGDVVEFVLAGSHHTVLCGKRISDTKGAPINYDLSWDRIGNFRIVSRASDKPKLWRDMTPEEKGALLLAMHDGITVEIYVGVNWLEKKAMTFLEDYAYRIKPEPKVEAVNQGYKTNSSGRFVTTSSLDHATHVVTFNLIDGEPDCTSIKIEKL